MEPDFSGYVTKAGLKCADGRTIMPDAFKGQHQTRVPLLWQHGHGDPENVLGHVLLENRTDGVYGYAFLNKSGKATHTRELVQHEDINSFSIWANQLVERLKNVLHGRIREVSLVLAGANPGALIDPVTIRHGEGIDDEVLEDEAIIYTGLALEFGHADDADDDKDKKDEKEVKDEKDKDLTHADGTNNADPTVQEVYDSLTDEQKDVVHFMIGQALEAADGNTGNDNTATHGDTTTEGNDTVKHNVFENGNDQSNRHVLSHDAMQGILTQAKQVGSLKKALEIYAEENLEHGITDIDTLFPDAKAISDTPEWNRRRTEWVTDLIGATRKSPFARIKTVSADITMDEARAKGYVTGNMKREEFFSVAKRITTPTTVYKKQALDRDDIVDITDFDVVTWMKGEMRLMLDEELGRAVLVGDGRDISSEDKINEQNIRPIASDHELYTTTVNVNVDDASSSMTEVLDAVILNRAKLKGSGTPNFYTTEYWIAKFLILRDGVGHRLFRNLEELALELRVAKIVPVEVMLEYPDIIGIMVNPIDYVMGADKGGQVSMFEDFDIDYNKEKFLIETRCSGALTKLKSALVLRKRAGTDVLVVPAVPTFDPETGELIITDTAHVVYKHGVTTLTNGGGPYAVPAGTAWIIDATPASGYYFATSDDDQWVFTADA